MPDLKTAFERAARDVQSLSERPGNEDLLRLYALYKQATEGDISVGVSSPRGGAKEKRVSFSKRFGRLESDGFNLLLGATLEKRSPLAATKRKVSRTKAWSS